MGGAERPETSLAVPGYWGLTRYPFCNVPPLQAFLPVGSHGSVLQSVITHALAGARRVLITGPRGVGRSCLVGVIGQVLNTEPIPASVALKLRDDGLLEPAFLLLVDDAYVYDLPHLFHRYGERETIIVACRGTGSDRMLHSLSRHIGVEAYELRYWSAQEVSQAVKSALARAGASNPEWMFTSGALSMLRRFTKGVPRKVARVVNLSLLVAAGRQARRVEEQDVVMAAQECWLPATSCGERRAA